MAKSPRFSVICFFLFGENMDYIWNSMEEFEVNIYLCLDPPFTDWFIWSDFEVNHHLRILQKGHGHNKKGYVHVVESFHTLCILFCTKKNMTLHATFFFFMNYWGWLFDFGSKLASDYQVDKKKNIINYVVWWTIIFSTKCWNGRSELRIKTS